MGSLIQEMVKTDKKAQEEINSLLSEKSNFLLKLEKVKLELISIEEKKFDDIIRQNKETVGKELVLLKKETLKKTKSVNAKFDSIANKKKNIWIEEIYDLITGE